MCDQNLIYFHEKNKLKLQFKTYNLKILQLNLYSYFYNLFTHLRI
jgi:hypothetical protein